MIWTIDCDSKIDDTRLKVDRTAKNSCASINSWWDTDIHEADLKLAGDL